MKPGNKKSLEVTRLKGSGPGGQNRNKRETGVRVKHVPTGVVATATERRSQEQNLKAAFERLEQKLEKLYHKPKPRTKTKPSYASRQRRIEAKRHLGRKKTDRKQRNGWD